MDYGDLLKFVNHLNSFLNVYDPEVRDPKGEIPPETPFEKLPDSWRCPRCGNPENVYYPEN